MNQDFDPFKQKLIFNNKELEDERSLEYYKIEEESILNCQIQSENDKLQLQQESRYRKGHDQEIMRE